MARLVRLLGSVVTAALLAGCGAGGESTPTTAPPSAPTSRTPTGSTSGTSVPTDGTTSPGQGTGAPTTGAPVVPTVDALAGYLATPADLGADWSLWEGFLSWPGGVPGVIPTDQRDLIPTIAMCPSAGETAVAAAEGLQWQAFSQLHRATPDEFANMVVVQQFLVADEPGQTAATFTTLRDGLTSCLTKNLPGGDWEIGRRDELAVQPVGDDRYAERSSSVDSGGARRDTRWVLVRDGAVLMAIQIDEVLITPDAEPVLTPEVVNDVISRLADKLP